MTDIINLLDDPQKISLLDQSNMLTSAMSLPDQIIDVWQQAKTFKVPNTPITNIVVSGMGGSALGAHVVRSVFKDILPVPLTIVNNYTLPQFVNQGSLVILISYSGTTEETLAAFESALEKKAHLTVMATGGTLIDAARTNQVPFFEFTVSKNPSNQPRMAIGYMVMGLLALLTQSQLISLEDSRITAIAQYLKSKIDDLLSPADHNPVKQLAYDLYDKIIFLVSSDHLTGPFHVFNNQLNENAKQLTVELRLPELNHHYMEGLAFPKFVPNQSTFIFADSALYHPRNRARIAITKEVVEQAGFQSHLLTFTAPDPLTQAFECIQYGMFVNLYLAFINGINPAPIPKVDYFKKRLASLS